MNNIDKFTKLFLEFEVETKKKVKNKDLQLYECIDLLRNNGCNPYYDKYSFIECCRRLRNILAHSINDNYFSITDETLRKLEDIVEEVKHPAKVKDKATHPVYSKNLNDKVLSTMKEMNDKVYTHIPIYSEDNRKLIGVFSENSLFQYIMENKEIEINSNTTFNDINKCIDINKHNDIVKFVDKDKLYDEVVNEFIEEFKKGNKLSCVMVTDNKLDKNQIIGIITAWDVIGR